MSDETIVAVYDTAAHAEAAVSALLAANVPQSAISQHADTTDLSAGTTAQPAREQGFWSSLFGGEPDHDTSVYDQSLRGGSTVVTVKVPEAHVASVMQILEAHSPIDIDERAASYSTSQTTTTTTAPLGSAMAGDTGMMAKTQSAAATTTAAMAGRAATATDDDTLQLSEERLAVGKRLVNRGGTRIRRFVVETPVEQQVTLHDEKVVLERRPVTDARPVGTADFSEKTIEMTESAEEAVVSKQAYVKEEISLRKQATERVETVRDTVRSEDIDVEQVPSERLTSTTTTTPVSPSVPGASKI